MVLARLVRVLRSCSVSLYNPHRDRVLSALSRFDNDDKSNCQLLEKTLSTNRRQTGHDELTPSCYLVYCGSGLRRILPVHNKTGESDKGTRNPGRNGYIFFRYRFRAAHERVNVYFR